MTWYYTVKPDNGNTVLDLTAATLVFDGRKCIGSSTGHIMVYIFDSIFEQPASKVTFMRDASGGGPCPSVEHKGGYAHIGFLGHKIRVLRQGKEINIDGTAFSVGGPKRTIIVPPSGKPYVKEAMNDT